nr:trypsin-like serine protease [Streptomyces sp. NBC_01001]
MVGTPAADGQYPYTAQLAVGEGAGSRACTATLIDQWWVATAASCFADNPQQPGPQAAGKPSAKATVMLSGGRRTEVTEIAPRSDRDLVLARLAVPAIGAATAKLATAAPATGGEFTVAGFGRTKTAWVFGATTVDATSVGITGKGTDSLCEGDTGAPVLNATGALAAVAGRSWQGGCFGTDAAETRTGAVAVRVDDLGAWIGRTTAPRRAAVNEAGGNERIRWADFDGDGKADYFLVKPDGQVDLYLNRGGDVVPKDGWKVVGRIATGLTTDHTKVQFVDFNADTHADYLLAGPGGSASVFAWNGGDPGNGWIDLGKVASGT